jgi:hypothetical protein
MEAKNMKIQLRYVTSLTFILLTACSENDLNVGGVDGAVDAPTNLSGTGGALSETGGALSETGGAPSGTGGTLFDAGNTGPSACDPLAPAPISLGTVFAVGKNSTGTIYAVDQVSNQVGTNRRVFVSDASGSLVRQRVNGEGSSSDSYDFNVSEPTPFVLQIDMPTGASVRMGVVQGTLKDRKDFVIGTDGEELTVLPNSTIASMPLRNLPGEVEDVATLPDGSIMLITFPHDDYWFYTDWRLFLGPTNAVAERTVVSVVRAGDGSPTILFDMDGTQASASFPVIYVDAAVSIRGPGTLTIADVTTSLTLQATPPSTAVYICL